MNQVSHISSIMSKHLITLSPDDDLTVVKDVFEKNSFHHLPIVIDNKPVGIISRSGFKGYLTALKQHFEEGFIMDVILKNKKVSEIMTKKLAKVQPEDSIGVALQAFSKNIVHSLLVVEKEELVGIITTHDVISFVAKEKINDIDYKNVSV